MFNHPGNKIKGFAKFIFVLGVIASIVLAIMVFVTAGEVYSGLESMLIIAGILILIVGPILSWLSVLVLYGFGELVENSTQIRQFMKSELSAPEKDRSSPASGGSAPDGPAGIASAPVYRVCPSCGARVAADAEFCTSCGSSIRPKRTDETRYSETAAPGDGPGSRETGGLKLPHDLR